MEIVQKVAKNHRNKTFSDLTPDDIEQHAALIAWEKIGDFDFSRANTNEEKQALENWLNRVVANRLINLKRDKYITPQKKRRTDKNEFESQKRINLAHPVSLEEVSSIEFSYTESHTIEVKELLEKVIKNLDPENRDILSSLMSGEEINPYYKKKLYSRISEILKDG